MLREGMPGERGNEGYPGRLKGLYQAGVVWAESEEGGGGCRKPEAMADSSLRGQTAFPPVPFPPSSVPAHALLRSPQLSRYAQSPSTCYVPSPGQAGHRHRIL